ncbi:MAG: hypothetical protein GX575_29965 [Candidatus Anammoximicrobium sp.]|nr:hypothetical protein [Candidatus Anammoximicrobium sp.]
MNQPRQTFGQRTRIALWLAIGGLCAIIASLPLLQSPAEQTKRHAAAVLANVPPGFGLYVEDRMCAECHPDQAASYPRTGHAHTLRPAAEWQSAADLDGKAFPDPERGIPYQYRFDPQKGLSVTAPDRFGNESFPLRYAFGSGRRGVTFLTLIPDRLGQTVGVEHRVSVRSGQSGPVLELAPGHQGRKATQNVEHFGRVIDAATLARCFDCHATRGEIREQEIRGLEPNVGCQKCHWPGRGHVLAMREAKARGEAVPTRPPPPPLEQIRACSRCHVQAGGDDELEAMPGHIRSVRVQASELQQSRCFIQSPNRLGCTTCHDPHAPVSSDPAAYVQRCLDCHKPASSAVCPVSPKTDCIRCHMPIQTAENEIQWHDHRIRRASKSELQNQ